MVTRRREFQEEGAQVHGGENSAAGCVGGAGGVYLQ